MPPPGKGIRQRLGLSESATGSASSSSDSRSSLGRWLSEQYATGRMRAADVATAASAECSDNPSARSDVASLAKAAPSKKRKVNEGERLDSRHCSRGVQRSLAKHSTFQLEPYVFSAPFWDATNEVSKPSDVECFFHTIFWIA